MAAQLAHKQIAAPAEIPDRLYFRIGDVARICGVEPYVLRFWESQFPALKPNKGGTGQRLYRRREVELAVRIKQLVHDQGYTLAGARQALESAPRARSPQKPLPLNQEHAQQRLDAAIAVIGRARAELRELVSQLSAPQPKQARKRSRLATLQPMRAPETDPLFPA
jgi:DNA-binding transcriptional MerR regulator